MAKLDDYEHGLAYTALPYRQATRVYLSGVDIGSKSPQSANINEISQGHHLATIAHLSSSSYLRSSLPIQRPGLITRVRYGRTSATNHDFRRFFVSAQSCNGGCAWETFGSAGFLYLRFISPRIAATHSPDNERGSSQFDMGVLHMIATGPSSLQFIYHLPKRRRV
jgi:hypothetical protein